MAANIPHSGRTEDGICDGVQQHVSIGVTEQSLVVGNLYTTNDELAPLHQSMYVPAFANTKIHSYLRSTLAGLRPI